MEQGGSARATLGVALLAGGTAWNAGNVGPVVSSLADDFSVSLSAVGVLSGTAFFAGVVVASFFAELLAARIGLGRTIWTACGACGAGNALFAASPAFSGLVAGRVVAGLGLGLAFIVGPVFARETGGVRRVGVFGGSVTLGIAAALGIGSVLEDAGVDWRAAFALSAVIGVSAIPFFPGSLRAEVPPAGHGAFLPTAIRSGAMWRLAALFVGAFSIQLVVGAWLIHYLTEGGMATTLAGALSFLQFAIAAAGRNAGGRLSAAGVSPTVLGGLAPLLAAGGLLAVAADRSLAVALPATLLMGVGFALPYAVMLTEAQRLFPEEPVASVALLQVAANAVPIAAIPAVGVALQEGAGAEAFVALAILVALAGVLNLRPALPRPEPAT